MIEEVVSFSEELKKTKNSFFMFNREISWLSFNDRVLQEAECKSVPLISRIRFLGIFSDNLDEFFKVRMASLHRLDRLNGEISKNANYLPNQLFQEIHNIVIEQQNKFQKIYTKNIQELEENGIFILNEKKLTPDQGTYIKKYFLDYVLSNLVPFIIENNGIFPSLKDNQIYLAVKLFQDQNSKIFQYSILEIPTNKLSRFLVIPSISNERKYIIFLDDIIRYCLNDLFAILNYNYFESYTFKITRDAELDMDLNISESFLTKIKKSVKQRSKGQPVRFVYDKDMPNDMLSFLKEKIKFDNNDSIISGGRYHNSRDFINFPILNNENLNIKTLPYILHPNIKPYNSIIQAIKQNDILLHYPYHSFIHFIDFLRESAMDPKVKKIKITAYRFAKKSKVIDTLINAAKNGKKITVVLELRARFDEEANIHWSSILQEGGVTVYFGNSNMKTHGKMCLISRKENNKIVHYANLSTGNYNEKTSNTYSDLSLFTGNKKITSDIKLFFNAFETSLLQIQKLKYIIPSPTHLRNKLNVLIDNEIQNKKNGHNAEIFLKMNNLTDALLIEKLYEASNVGVSIKLIIRGICCLIPGIKGMSENIKAISIIDIYLEHSRVYIFHNLNNEKIYISSADFMTRNIDHRIEITVPIYDENIKNQIKKMLAIQWKDNQKARIIDCQLKNKLKTPKNKKEDLIRSQIKLRDFYNTQK